jgi:HlyD family secretion protein
MSRSSQSDEVLSEQRAVVGDLLRGTREQWVVKRAAFIALPLVTLVIVGATVVVANGHSGPELTLAAKVEEGQVSKMLTGKGVVSAAKTVNLNFQTANWIKVVDVKVGDKVKKGQKLGEQNNGGRRRALLQAQQSLAQSQAALDLILNDVNPRGLERIYERWKRVANQARHNIDLKESADRWTARRSEHALHVHEKALDQARDKLEACRHPMIPTMAPPACTDEKTKFDAAKLTVFNDRTTMVQNWKNLKVNRGGLISTYRTARKDAVTAYNTWNIARVNRPNQILAARAAVANALVNVGNAQGNLGDSYIYAPIDGTVSAIAGTVGEFNPGGNNLTPNTPVAPGGTVKVPSVGELAGNDQKSLTGGQGPNLGLQAVLPGGNTFMQLSDVSAFSVVAAFPQNEASAIKPGDSAKTTLDALSGKVVDGKVASVSPIGTPGANGVPMYYATVLLNKDQVPDHLLSGQTGNVSVVTSTIENKAMVVPTSAVTEDDGQSFVTVPGPNNTQVKKPFTAGPRGDDNTQVVDGLKPGDTVMMPEGGRLPKPANDKAPIIGGDQPLNMDAVSPPPRPVAEPDAAPPAPATVPVAATDTYPGDPGDVPDVSADSGSSGPAGNPNGGTAGVNPFAPLPAAPAPSNSGN